MSASFGPLLAATFFSSVTVAQCGLSWHYAEPRPGLPHDPTQFGVVCHATTEWDPDGTGPTDPVVLVGGYFAGIPGSGADNLATWVPSKQRWQDHLPGINGPVRAFATLPNGDLVAAGSFDVAGTTSAANIARWDGSQWHAFGLGLNQMVETVAVASNGDLIAGGWFLWSGTQPMLHIARWDGTQWQALGSGFDHPVMDLTVASNGDLIAAGEFEYTGTTWTPGVARWNGSSWSAMGSGLPGPVLAVETLPNGDIIAGGSFELSTSIGYTSVARFDGTSWTSLGPQPVTAVILALEVAGNGDVYAGGSKPSLFSSSRPFLTRFDGTSWSSHLDEEPGAVVSLHACSNGEVICGGLFSQIDNMDSPGVARYDGTSWLPMGPGLDAAVHASITLQNGDLLIAGDFEAVDGRRIRHIAQRSGTAATGYIWTNLGAGIDGHVGALLQLPNGDVLARGAFATAGGVPANNVARWDGASWHAMGTVASAYNDRANLAFANGKAFTTSDSDIQGWNGTSWTTIGTLGAPTFTALQATATDLIVAGAFGDVSGVPADNIARWDGTGWSAIGAGLPYPVLTATYTPSGKLIASYSNQLANGGTAIWDGTTWQPFAQGSVHALASDILELPHGDLIFAGGLIPLSGPPILGIARWDGSSWTPFDAGVELSRSLAFLPSGELVVGGYFSAANGQSSPFLTGIATDCPALVSSSPPACPGTGQPQLAANTQPWLGASLRTTATGLPTQAWALTVYGSAAAATPLPSLLSQSQPGCTLLVTASATVAQFSSSGTVSNSFLLPAAAVLAGLPLHQQVVALGVDTSGSTVSATASNALAMTLGSF